MLQFAAYLTTVIYDPIIIIYDLSFSWNCNLRWPYNYTVITTVNYDRKTFIVQATECRAKVFFFLSSITRARTCKSKKYKEMAHTKMYTKVPML